MTTVIFGLDGIDSRKVSRGKHLEQDFQGENALYTYRIWPCLFAGEVGGESNQPYEGYDPVRSYVWESYQSRTVLAPIEKGTALSINTDHFPREYMETFDEDRMIDTLQKIEWEVREATRNGEQLVVACTRIPDMAQHMMPKKAEQLIQATLDMVDRCINLKGVDDYMVVSDHGFGELGASGIEAHTRHSMFASSFCDYDTMTGLCEGWREDLDELLLEQQMEALGYK